MGVFDFFRKRRKVRPSSDLSAIIVGSRKAALSDSGLFVESALRAAQVSQMTNRRTILVDLASVLDCDATELDFLFVDRVMAANDADPVALPDYRQTLRADALAVAH